MKKAVNALTLNEVIYIDGKNQTVTKIENYRANSYTLTVTDSAGRAQQMIFAGFEKVMTA